MRSRRMRRNILQSESLEAVKVFSSKLILHEQQNMAHTIVGLSSQGVAHAKISLFDSHLTRPLGTLGEDKGGGEGNGGGESGGHDNGLRLGRGDKKGGDASSPVCPSSPKVLETTSVTQRLHGIEHKMLEGFDKCEAAISALSGQMEALLLEHAAARSSRAGCVECRQAEARDPVRVRVRVWVGVGCGFCV